jgi:preprotein translocase subunit SecG
LIYVLYALEVIVCMFLILVVLLQQGSGADLSVFGGGATQTAFGARGTTQFIHKLTVWAFVAFILLTLAIAVMKSGDQGSSVIVGTDPAEVEQPATAEEPAAQPAVPAPVPTAAADAAPVDATAPPAPAAGATAPASQPEAPQAPQ